MFLYLLDHAFVLKCHQNLWFLIQGGASTFHVLLSCLWYFYRFLLLLWWWLRYLQMPAVVYTVFLVKQLHYFFISGNIFTFLAACLAFTCIEVSLLANEIQRPGGWNLWKWIYNFYLKMLLFKISHVLCFHIPFQFVLQQLGVLISIVKQHIRNYLDEIFGLIKVRLCTLLCSILKRPCCLVNSAQRTAGQ